MAHSRVWSTDQPIDTTIRGPEASADYGRGATFDQRGDMAGAYTKEQVVSAFSSTFDEAYRYRLSSAEDQMMTAYQQYHGDTETAGKAEWQSQVHVPLSAQACNVAAGKITNVIFGNEEWFDTRSKSRAQDGRAERGKKMVQWQFDRSAAQDAVNQSVKDAMICGTGVLKVHVASEIDTVTDTKWKANPPAMFMDQQIDMGGKWVFTETRKEFKRMRFESLVPTDFWLDPSGLNRFYIQRIKRSLSDIWALAKDQKGDDGKTVLRKAVYDPDVVKLISAGSRDVRLDNQAAIIRHERVQSTALSQQLVDVYEFWGDLIDPTNGVAMFRNIFATFVDKRFCIRMPQRNPYLHRASPFIFMPAQLLPHQIYGYGLLGQTAKLQNEIDRVLQIMVDRVHLCVPMYEVDDTKLRNPEQVQGDNLKFSPGKIFKTKRSADPNATVFKATQTAQPMTESEPKVYEFLMQALQMVGYNNEWASGSPQTTQRKTKEEVQARAGASQQVYNEAAQYIEQTALTPLVNLVYKLMIQFVDEYDDPSLLDLFADQPEDQQALMGLSQMSAEERWNAMRLDTEFEVNGITRDIDRNARIQRVQTFMQMIGADPTYAQLIDKAWFLRELLQDLDLPKEAVLPNAEAMLQSMQAGMIQQVGQPPDPNAQAAGGQPGAPAQVQQQTTQQLSMGQNQHNARTQSGAASRQPAPS